MGMTDLQFKAYVAEQKSMLEEIKACTPVTEEKAHAIIDKQIRKYDMILNG